MASALRGAAHSQAGRKRLKYRSLTPAADMLCLPSTTAQCRISVRFLENRPHASSSRAPCSHIPAEGNRRLDDHPPWRLAPCCSLLPYLTSLSSRPPCQRSPSSPPAAMPCSSKRLARRDSESVKIGLRSSGCSPPTHLFVRCPFLVRCSSQRSNEAGGSPHVLNDERSEYYT